jgi:hypothetical protein
MFSTYAWWDSIKMLPLSAGPDGKFIRRDSLDSNVDSTTVMGDSVLDSQELDENDALDDDIDEDDEAETEAQAAEGVSGIIAH